MDPIRAVSAERPRNIPTLDGWRAIAILLVMTHHLGTEFYSPETYWSRSPTRFGTEGVPIFFAISGLLICKLLLEEYAAKGAISLRAFYIRRCFRILPPLFAFLLGAVALGCVTNRLELLSSVFFFRNYLPDSAASAYTAHLWSLSVEEHFYLLWPSVLCLLLTTRRPAFYAAILAFGFGVWRALDVHLHLIARLIPFLDGPMRTDYRLDGMLWGCVAAFALQSDTVRDFAHRWLRPIGFAVVFACLCICLTRAIPLAPIWRAIAVPLLLLATITHPHWLLSRFLDLAPVRWIGRISYSLYLWQQLFLVPAWEPHLLPLVQSWWCGPVVAFGAAAVSYYFIEKPLMRLGRVLAARAVLQAHENCAGAIAGFPPRVV